MAYSCGISLISRLRVAHSSFAGYLLPFSVFWMVHLPFWTWDIEDLLDAVELRVGIYLLHLYIVFFLLYLLLQTFLYLYFS